MNADAQKTRAGFTLVELVIVVLVLGIIAAAAAPKLFDTAGDARSNSTRQSLVIVRNALELYRAQNDEYPAGADIKTDLADYIQGPFPSVQAGGNKNADVEASTDNPVTVKTGGKGWVYNETTGEFRVNDASMLAW